MERRKEGVKRGERDRESPSEPGLRKGNIRPRGWSGLLYRQGCLVFVPAFWDGALPFLVMCSSIKGCTSPPLSPTVTLTIVTYKTLRSCEVKGDANIFLLISFPFLSETPSCVTGWSTDSSNVEGIHCKSSLLLSLGVEKIEMKAYSPSSSLLSFLPVGDTHSAIGRPLLKNAGY